MRCFKTTLAYDGTEYAGWQFQPGRPTIQETLEKTLAKITGESIKAVASGRTDAGVHALGQVVSFSSDTHLATDVLMRALNAELPDDIVVVKAEDVRDGFHAIRDAIRKRYRYHLHDGSVRELFRRKTMWHLPKRVDAEAMHRAAQTLLGKHDFSSFESSGAERSSSVRTVSDVFVRRRSFPGETEIIVEIEADGFLYNMVRTIVGTLVEVGRGSRDEIWPGEVLALQDRKRAGATAPPQGLFLVSVDYLEE